MRYRDFEIQVGPRTGDGYVTRVVRSPAGESEPCLLVLPEALRDDPASLLGRRMGEASAERIGGELFDALFTGAVGRRFHESLTPSDGGGEGLRIRLQLNPADRSIAALHRTPWELLHRRETGDWLAMSRGIPMVRSLSVPRPPRAGSWAPPLRVLILLGQDPDGDEDTAEGEREARLLTDLLDEQPHIECELLEAPDLGELRLRLSELRPHVLHYIGHGFFDPYTGEGSLPFRGRGDRATLVTGAALATAIRDVGDLRLAVLNACDTACSGDREEQAPFAGLAPALVQGGLPAVVAMQTPISAQRAIAFSREFYRTLASEGTVEEAAMEGRQAIHGLGTDEAQWAIPVLFLRNGVDWVFPAPAAEVEPVREGGRSGRLVGLVVALVLLLGAAAGLSVRSYLDSGAVLQEPASTEDVDEPIESDPPPASPPLTRSVVIGSGAQAVRWSLEAPSSFSPRTLDAFAAGIRERAAPVPSFLAQAGADGLGVVTVRLTAPSVEPSSVREGWKTCQLSASCVLAGPGPARWSTTLGASGSQSLETGACWAAATALADGVVRGLATHLKEALS